MTIHVWHLPFALFVSFFTVGLLFTSGLLVTPNATAASLDANISRVFETVDKNMHVFINDKNFSDPDLNRVLGGTVFGAVGFGKAAVSIGVWVGKQNPHLFNFLSVPIAIFALFLMVSPVLYTIYKDYLGGKRGESNA